MAKPKIPRGPKADVEVVLAEFDAMKDTLARFCAKTKSLVEAILQHADIRYQSVQARVKTRGKLREKYLDPAKGYRRLDDITDLAGLRVITYYEDEIDRVAEVIRREFDIDPENSVDKRDTEPDRFGYKAVNYVCGHLEKRKADVEYQEFAEIRCEIQVTSILSHAWSEIEHDWYDLKDNFPDDIKRRFARMAALVEIAELEFLSLRKARSDYQRSVAIQVEARVPDIPVDAVSLKSFIMQESIVSDLDQLTALAMDATLLTEVSDKVMDKRAAGAKLAGIAKLEDLRTLLEEFRAVLPVLMRQFNGRVWSSPGSSISLSPGICVFALTLLLVGLRGEQPATEFMMIFEPNGSWDIPRLLALCSEIILKR